MKLRNTIIYLIGIPAVGKYTTAKAIAKLTGAKVVDNQLINNPIFTVAGYDGTDKIPVPKEAWTAIEKVRRTVLGFIRHHAATDASFVFTNVLQDAPGDRRLFRRIERLAKTRGGIFVPVWLTCKPSEIRRRKNRPDRRERMKDIDLTNINFLLGRASGQQALQLRIVALGGRSVRALAQQLDPTGKLPGGDWVGQGTASCAQTLGCLNAATGLPAMTDCMLAASPAVSHETSELMRCFVGAADPLRQCRAQIQACAAR